MKRTIIISVLLMISFFAHAQRTVTQFLGIPVDGSKAEMVRKLKSKGFVGSISNPDMLTGEFNGKMVYINVITNNNKVWRIFLIDKNGTQSETDIRLRFNELCRQFEKNPRYISLGEQTIPEDEDIAHNILVNDKRYQACYFQKTSSTSPKEEDGDVTKRSVWFKISRTYGEYYIAMYYDNEYNMANGEDL